MPKNSFDSFFKENKQTKKVDKDLFKEGRFSVENLSELFIYTGRKKAISKNKSNISRIKSEIFKVISSLNSSIKTDYSWFEKVLASNEYSDDIQVAHDLHQQIKKDEEDGAIEFKNHYKIFNSKERFNKKNMHTFLNPSESYKTILSNIQKCIADKQHICLTLPYKEQSDIKINISPNSDGSISFLMVSNHPKNHDQIIYQQHVFSDYTALEEFLQDQPYKNLISENNHCPIIFETYKKATGLIQQLVNWFAKNVLRKQIQSIKTEGEISHTSFVPTSEKLSEKPGEIGSWGKSQSYKSYTSYEKLMFRAAINGDSKGFFEMHKPGIQYSKGFLETIYVRCKLMQSNSKSHSIIASALEKNTKLDKNYIVEGTNKFRACRILDFEIVSNFIKSNISNNKLSDAQSQIAYVLYNVPLPVSRQFKMIAQSNKFLKDRGASIKLDPKGCCSAFSFLYGYAKSISKEESQQQNIYSDDFQFKYDDIFWFNTMYTYLENREAYTKRLNKKKIKYLDSEFERFLTLVNYYQESSSTYTTINSNIPLQHSPELFYSDTRSDNLTCELDLAISVTQERLTKYLNEIPKGRYCQLTTNKHTVAIYKNLDNTISFLNVNNYQPEKEFSPDEIPELSYRIISEFSENGPYKKNSIYMSILNFNKHKISYDYSELAKMSQSDLDPELALYMLLKMGSNIETHPFIDKVDLSIKIHNINTIMMAVNLGHASLENWLKISKHYKLSSKLFYKLINSIDDSLSMSPVAFAISCKYYDSIKTLLDWEANIYLGFESRLSGFDIFYDCQPHDSRMLDICGFPLEPSDIPKELTKILGSDYENKHIRKFLSNMEAQFSTKRSPEESIAIVEKAVAMLKAQFTLEAKMGSYSSTTEPPIDTLSKAMNILQKHVEITKKYHPELGNMKTLDQDEVISLDQFLSEKPPKDRGGPS